MTETLRSVGVDRLMPDPSQPRKQFIASEIERMAASITARGVLVPLRIFWSEEQQLGRIVLGEGRWRASKLAGLTHVPCLLVEGVSELEILTDQIIENAVRSSLSPVDYARALKKLKALKGCTAQQLAADIGISGASITRAEGLLTLPESVLAMVENQSLSESTAYEISRLDSAEAQIELANLVVAKGLPRDQVAEAVRNRLPEKKTRPKASRLACRVDGVCVTLTAAVPLTWDTLIASLDASRKLARKLSEAGNDVTAFAKAAQGQHA